MKTKKRIKNILLIAALYIFLMFFININFAANTATVSTETAKLRKEPSTTATVLELVSMGEEVEIIEKQGEWYKVIYQKITGYIREDLLQVNAQENETTTASENGEENQENNKLEIEQQEEQPTEVQSTEEQPAEEQAVESQPVEVQNEEIVENEIGTYKVIKQSIIKIIPLITSLDLRQMNVEENVVVTDVINNWAWITTSDNINGWVRIENLEKVNDNTTLEIENQTITQQEADNTDTTQTSASSQTIKTMYVNSQVVNIRKNPNTTAEVLERLELNTAVTVISEENGWYKVEVNEKEGYIAKTLLSDTK